MNRVTGSIFLFQELPCTSVVGTNIALNKDVKMKSVSGDHKPENAVDGNPKTMIHSARNLPVWFYVDLGAIACVKNFRILSRGKFTK